MPPRPLTRLRKLSLALPEAHEVEAWGEPTFRVRNKMFAMFANAKNHHGAGRNAVWIKGTLADQKRLLRVDPEQFFRPPYVGPNGWVGSVLDGDADWELVAELLAEGYRLVAPNGLIERLDTPGKSSPNKARSK